MEPRHQSFKTKTDHRPSRPRGQRVRRPGVERLEERALLTLNFTNALGVGANGISGVETTGVAVDSAGDRFMTGSFTGTVDFGGLGASTSLTSNGQRDGFVVKYTPTGQIAYLKGFGGTLNDRAAAVALDSQGDAFLTGYYTGLVTFSPGETLNSIGTSPATFVWKLSPTGQTDWLTASLGSTSNNQPQSIAVDPLGQSVAIGGFFTGALTLGTKTLTSTGNSDGFVAKLSAVGTNVSFTWASQLAASAGSTAIASSVAIDPSGNVVAAGQFQGVVDFDPGLGFDIVTSNSNSIDPFVEKLNSANGSLVFAYTPSGPGQDIASGVGTDAQGNIFVIGAYQQTLGFTVNGAQTTLTAPALASGFFLLGLSPAGTGILARSLNAVASGAFDTDYGSPALAMNPDGEIAVATTFTNTAAQPNVPSPVSVGQSDVLVETLDEQGNVLQMTTAGGAGADFANAVSLTSTGVVAVSGSYTGPATFGSTTLQTLFQSSLGVNIFAATLTPAPVIPGDFLAKGFTQPAIYHEADATWEVQGAPGIIATFGWAGHDLPAPGDYEDTGTTQVAVYRPSTAQWFVQTSAGSTTQLPTFGWVNHDVPAPGDYDDLGRTEQAVYRPSTAQWFVNGPGGSRLMATFGWAGHDIPVPGDYLGLGYDQIAVYRPSTGQWFVLMPNGATDTLSTFGWAGNDIPVPGDYTNSGHEEQAVFRPSTGEWFVNGTSGAFTTFGMATPAGTTPFVDIPALTDTGTLNGLPAVAPSVSVKSSVVSVGSSFGQSLRAAATIGQAAPKAVAGTSSLLASRGATFRFPITD